MAKQGIHCHLPRDDYGQGEVMRGVGYEVYDGEKKVGFIHPQAGWRAAAWPPDGRRVESDYLDSRARAVAWVKRVALSPRKESEQVRAEAEVPQPACGADDVPSVVGDADAIADDV